MNANVQAGRMTCLRVGLVGCGVMGEHYARVIAQSNTVALAAVCDLDEARAADFRARRGAERAHADHRDMLDAGHLDAVIVATPDSAHRAPVCDALVAGLPVLCEKPLATTLADADAIVGAARAADRPVMVNFGNRHRPNARRVRELLRAGDLGRVGYVYARLNERLCKTRTIPWLAQTSPVWFLLSHCVDLVRWLLNDDFAQVYARAAYGAVDDLAPGVPDTCAALCTTRGGVCVNLESSWAMPDAYFGNIDFALQVIGDRGAVQADLFPHDLQFHRHDGAMVQDYSMGVALPAGHTMGWWEESTRSFFHAVATGGPVSPTAQEGREVTRTLVALDRSLAEGRAVALDE